jgi:hypothetical protein
VTAGTAGACVGARWIGLGAVTTIGGSAVCVAAGAAANALSAISPDPMLAAFLRPARIPPLQESHDFNALGDM